MDHLQSVRLVHKQSVPHYYFINEVYSPTDEEARARGEFVIVLSHRHAIDGQLLRRLASTLVREYYRQRQGDLVDRFETALQRINDTIKQSIQTSDATSPQIAGAIILRHKQEIHISHIGQPEVYLARRADIIPLSAQSNSSTEPQFGVITSGDVQAGDRFLIVTPGDDQKAINTASLACLQQERSSDAGRQLMKDLRKAGERSVQAMLFTLTDKPSSNEVIYMDGPLETRAEKVERLRATATRTGKQIAGGAMVVGASVGRSATPFLKQLANTLRKPAAKKTVAPKQAESSNKSDEAPDGMTFKAYWERNADRSPSRRTKKSKPSTAVIDHLKHIRPRTWYLLGGTLLALIIFIRAANALIHANGTTDAAGQTTSNSAAAVITQANALIKSAEKAEIDSDKQSAIVAYSQALSKLQSVAGAAGASYEYKTAYSQASGQLGQLTNARTLNQPSSSIDVPGNITDLKLIAGQAYAIDSQNDILQLGATAKTVATLPNTSTPLDLTASGSNSLAVITDKHELDTIDTQSGAIKPIGGTWPAARLIDHYGSNLYFVSDTLTRATPNGSSYSLSTFYSGLNTSTARSITSDGFFYALEGDKSIVRIASNAGATPINLTGMPDAFWPTKFTALLSTQESDSAYLYLFDRDGQRIIYVTKDGVYKGEYQLPKDYDHCDTDDTQLVCSFRKTVDTYGLK